jgi:hypothetical protein
MPRSHQLKNTPAVRWVVRSQPHDRDELASCGRRKSEIFRYIFAVRVADACDVLASRVDIRLSTA